MLPCSRYLFAVALLLASTSASPDSLPTASETVNVSTPWVCGGPQTAILYYPKDSSKTYPLVSFAHGWTAGGGMVPTAYSKLLAEIASAGYVVIATEDAPSNLCQQQTEDQIASFEHMKTSRNPRVDWSMKTAFVGHSMGAFATVLSAANAEAVKKWNVAAAVPLHAGDFLNFKSPVIPTFYTTGSSDTIIPPTSSYSYYQATTAKGKVFAELTGANHFEPTNVGPCRLNSYVPSFLDCYVRSNATACDRIYGNGVDSLCHSSGIPMTGCVSTGKAAEDLPKPVVSKYLR